MLIARATGRPSQGVWASPQEQTAVSVLRRAEDQATWSADPVGSTEHLPPELRSDK